MVGVRWMIGVERLIFAIDTTMEHWTCMATDHVRRCGFAIHVLVHMRITARLLLRGVRHVAGRSSCTHGWLSVHSRGQSWISSLNRLTLSI